MRGLLIMMIVLSIFMYGCKTVEDEQVDPPVVEEDLSVVLVDEEAAGDEALERSEYREISPEDAHKKLEEDSEILLMDVRTKEEYDGGYIENAELLPLDTIEDQVETLYPDKEQTIYVYCRSGRRSESAANILLDLGYREVYDLGGIIDWPYEIVQ